MAIIKADNIELLNIEEEQPIELPTEAGLLLRTIHDYITFEKRVEIQDFWAEDSNLYPVFYEPNVRCFLIEARCRYGTASTSGTLTVEKLTNGTAKGSGQSMLASTFNLALSANGLQLRGSTTVFAGSQLTPGDAIALRSGGTLAGLRNISVTVLFGINMKDIPSGQSASTVISGL